jgi:hypothetical protein
VRTTKAMVGRAAVVVAALLLLAGPAPGARAEPPTADPALAAAFGARWLATQITPGGYVAGPSGDPAGGPTLQAALALAAAGVEAATFDRLVAWMEANVESVIAPGGIDSAGALGYLLLVIDAAGADPAAFGGIDLVSRLQGTLGVLEPGLYGATDPTFDGVFRQSLALLGQQAHGVAPAGAAVTWLRTQQCGGGSPSSALGGWESYRADTATPCGPPDPVTFTGPETNSTAVALQALAALGQSPDIDARGFLAATQGADGGFPFLAGVDVDPNSTALTIQALVALGDDPADWTTTGGSPWSSLLGWQLGCDTDPADMGAFASAFSDGFPDLFATLQAVWGTSGRPFPLGAVAFEPTPVPCEAGGPPGKAPTPVAGGAPVTGGGGAGPAGRVTPRFTG